MALNITQTPKYRENGIIQPVSPTIYPLFSSWTNTQNNVYTDYRYKVELYDENGYINAYSIVSQTPNQFGTLSITNYTNSVLVNVVQSKINSIKNCPNQMGNYQVKVVPYNNGTYLPGSQSDTFHIMKSSYDRIMWDLYGDKLFVDHPKKKLTTKSYGTNKSLYGQFSRTNNLFAVSWNRVEYRLTKVDGTTIDFYLQNNYTYSTMATESTLNNSDNKIIEFPIGPANIMESFDMVVSKIVLPNGFTFYPGGIMPIYIESGDKYSYATYKQTLYSDDQISQWYDIEVVDCETRFEPLTFNFLNDNGGYDTFVFYSKTELTIQNKQDSYLKYPYHRKNNTYYKTNEYNRGQEVYKDNIDEIINTSSNWLTDEEVIELKQLWTSPDVYIQYNGELTPVIIKEIGARVYNKKNKSLSKYIVDFVISDKKYRI